MSSSSLYSIFTTTTTIEEKVRSYLSELESWIGTISDRLKSLNERYIVNALITLNPFVERLIDDYLEFKNRRHINPTVAGTDEKLLAEIIRHNAEMELVKEKSPTILCCIDEIKDMRSDIFPSRPLTQ